MNYQRGIAALALAAATLFFSSSTIARDNQPLEEVVVAGIRESLAAAVDQKRNSDNPVEIVIAEDIGKLPDQDLAEVPEKLAGIQITRTAGVATGVQIRRINSNRVEFNGVSTASSGSGPSGINFEDVNPAIISVVEVTTSPDARST